MRYTVTDDAVTIEHRAETDAPTVVSLTNHTYFNLAGGGTVDDHRLTVAADAFLPVDAESIPLGRPEPVQDTPFDFRAPTTIGGRVRAHASAGAPGGGHRPRLRRAGDGHRVAARLEHPASGRSLEVSTTQPSVQVYTGNKLDGSLLDRDGRRLEARAGVALECQGYPDAPNQPGFPSAVLRPGEQYLETTVWRFGTT